MVAQDTPVPVAKATADKKDEKDKDKDSSIPEETPIGKTYCKYSFSIK